MVHTAQPVYANAISRTCIHVCASERVTIR